MLSLITPTHNPQHLNRLYESLKAQTNKGFEWVIVPNNGAVVDLPKENWIKIIPFTEETKLIGAIKNFAFNQGKREWLVELDHDDELLPNCVQRLIEESADNDFLSSDCLEVRPDGSYNIYSSSLGWRSYEYDGHQVNKTFPITPQSLSYIWYAPNHIRAWKTSFYRKIGGHNKELKALDDQDLMCRTYLNGKMKHIQEPLYKYNFHASNSFSGELNAWIQEYTQVLHDQYITPMMEKWCDEKGLMKLDLCGGHNPPSGYTSIDLLNGTILHDLEVAPWPLQDNSVGIVRASDALEHMKDPITTMKEIHRILAPGGMLLSNTPSTDGRGAFQDPTHKSFWNSNSFWYYSRAQTAAYINTPVRFQATRVKNHYPSEWHEQMGIVYVNANLTALKGGDEWAYAPGPITI
jgi:glycosyltransferase involved in cell wall biosynthesis